MATATQIGVAEAVGPRFLAALVQQDWAVVEGCFDGHVQFRALTPPGLREVTDPVAAAGYLRQWFGDATDLHLVASAIEALQDRLSIRYRGAAGSA